MSEDKKTLLVITLETTNKKEQLELLDFLATYPGVIYEVEYTGVSQ
jgi:hypothetical protein